MCLTCHFKGPIFSFCVKLGTYIPLAPPSTVLLWSITPLSGNYITSFPFQTAVSFHSVINSTKTALLQRFAFYYFGDNEEEEKFSVVHCCNPHIWSITGLKDDGHMYLFPVLNMWKATCYIDYFTFKLSFKDLLTWVNIIHHFLSSTWNIIWNLEKIIVVHFSCHLQFNSEKFPWLPYHTEQKSDSIT